jgi:hypothetical protein
LGKLPALNTKSDFKIHRFHRLTEETGIAVEAQKGWDDKTSALAHGTGIAAKEQYKDRKKNSEVRIS